MTLTDRDRKLLLFIVPAVVLVAYWFLLLSPVRQDASKLGDDLAKQEQTRDDLQAQVAQLGQARDDFAADYAAVVELGKAVPTSVDMPSLLVQLDRAAHGTGIDFERITAGQRQSAAAAPSATGSPPSGPNGTPAAAAGGPQASTGPGKAVEKANNTKAQQDGAAQSGGSAAPPTGAAQTAAGSTQTSGVPGLDAVPLDFTFRGDFFNLADFFHRLKRFVHVVNDRVDVRGRLMTIEGVDFKATSFPRLEAQVTAKVYLTPKGEGTAGATPTGPSTSSASQASGPAPSTSAPPAAAAVSR
jgi:Type II secretion system (T2SS), protein M